MKFNLKSLFRTTILKQKRKLLNSTKALDPVLFGDDTTLFCTNNNIRALSETANQELSQINDWFLANKVSIPLNLP